MPPYDYEELPPALRALLDPIEHWLRRLISEEVRAALADRDATKPDPYRRLTFKELADRLGVSTAQVSVWMREGLQPDDAVIPVGERGRRFDQLKVEAWLRGRYGSHAAQGPAGELLKVVPPGSASRHPLRRRSAPSGQ